MFFRDVDKSEIFQEMNPSDREFWFSFQDKKFLHNIDTFYYSVKYLDDFTSDTESIQVKRLRRFFRKQYDDIFYEKGYGGFGILTLPGLHDLNIVPFTFSRFYTVCLQYPEYFDIFLAPKVPRAGKDQDASVTCEMIVQIRSYMLWMFGVHAAYEKSYEYVRAISDMFDLSIAFTQENRIDYCWHSNYLHNPEKYFTIEKFYAMRVDRFRGASFHTAKVGADDFEVDYISMGNRSDKIFIRIYLKTKEVIEKGYKPWFFKVWLMNGMINRYDNYVYEKCFLRHSWHYRFKARLEFYLEYGRDESLRYEISRLLSDEITMGDETVIRLAKKLTPEPDPIVNVEYQTMRRHSKTYQLVPFKDNSARSTSKRIYDYLDNRSIIIDHLTHQVFRMVDPNGTGRKCRRDYTPFWKMLRRAKGIDTKRTTEQIRLFRDYSRKLNSAVMKKRAIDACVTYGIYTKGINYDNPLDDIMHAILRLNDNDVHDAILYKSKKVRQFSPEELTDTLEDALTCEYEILEHSTGVVYRNDKLDELFCQEEGEDL